MSNNLRYNIIVAHLDSSDVGKRNHLYERVIYQFSDFGKARDKFIELSIQADPSLSDNKYDYAYELDEMKEDFSIGADDNWYRINFKEIKDYADNALYIGPGAYVLKGSLLQ